MIDEPQILVPFSREEAIPIRIMARLAGISEQTARNWCVEHGLGRRIGGRWWGSRVALAMFQDGDKAASSRSRSSPAGTRPRAAEPRPPSGTERRRHPPRPGAQAAPAAARPGAGRVWGGGGASRAGDSTVDERWGRAERKRGRRSFPDERRPQQSDPTPD